MLDVRLLKHLCSIICPSGHQANNVSKQLYWNCRQDFFLALIEKEGYVVGGVPKVNNALDEMDSNGIVVSSEHNQALHFLLQPKLYIPSTMNTC